MRTNPRPTPDAMPFYYPDTYGPHQLDLLKRATHVPWWKRLIAALVPLQLECLPHQRPGRLLEIGCGTGAFMKHMAERGWEVEGLEASPRAAQLARSLGFQVTTSTVEKARDPLRPYDLVLGWMVLEHLHDPVGALRKLARWTVPGGWLVLSVPDAAAMEFTTFKHAWYALQLPTHLFHFTPSSLRNVLAVGGWRTERVIHQRVVGNLFASLGYELQDRGWGGGLARFLVQFPDNGPMQYVLFPLGFLLGLVGQTGRMIVWAKLHA